jgi:hypothetical protein
MKKNPKWPDGHNAYIVRFCDGDTAIALIELRWGVWIEKSVRLKGIESWELGSPDEGRARSAAAKLTKELGWTPATFVPSQEGTDCYGRLLGDLLINGESVAQHAVDQLCAWWGAPGTRPAHQEPECGPISKPIDS